MNEVWKNLQNIGYPNYYVSNLGNVKGKNGILKYSKSGSLKYPCVKLYNEKGNRIFLVHRLVAMMFVDNPNNYNEVSHEDNNPQNPIWTNLKWTTHVDNCRHSQSGEQRCHSKLKEVDVIWILEHHIVGDKQYGSTAMSRRFGVGVSTIQDIVKGRTWKHLHEVTR